ncbi:MAG: hypothetical protein ACI9KE_004261 [Polyangiales bacterium]|jgi:hypothetical protein
MSMDTPRKGVIVLVGIGVVVGSLTVARYRDESDEAAAAAEVEVLQMATAEQVDTFGRELMDQLEQNTVPEGVIDWGVLAGRTLPEGASDEARLGFIEGVEQGAAQNDFLQQLRLRMEAGDRMNYRGVAERGEHPVARFRLIMATGGVNFFDFLLAMREGQPKIVDFFQLTGGRWQSEGVADMFRGAFIEGPGAMERVMGERNPIIEHAEDIGNLGQLIQAQNPQGALALYAGLPEAVRHHRVVFGLAIDATTLLALDDPRRLTLLDEFEATFPNDPAAAARLLDAHFERQQWDSVHADLDALNEAFPDSYWLALRARVLLLQGRQAEATTEAARAVALEPELLETHDAMLIVALATGDTDMADAAAQTLRDDFGVRFELIADNPDYAGVMALGSMQPRPQAPPASPLPPNDILEPSPEATP